MAEAIDITADGRVKVKIGSDDFTFDAYRVHNSLITIRNRIADEEKPVEDFHEAVVEYFQANGLPTLTHFQADRLVTSFERAVIELGKELTGGGTQSSPVSTEQTHSDLKAA